MLLRRRPPFVEGGSAQPHQCPLGVGSTLSLLLCADARLHIPTTHRIGRYDDDTLVDKRVAVPMTLVKTRTVTIVDELPPVVAARAGRADAGFASSTLATIGADATATPPANDQRTPGDLGSASAIIIVDGQMLINATFSVPFEDPGIEYVDNHDTHETGLTTILLSQMQMADATAFAEIKSTCARSVLACRQQHGGKAYVGGLGEAGYPLAPHEDYVAVPGSDMQVIRSDVSSASSSPSNAAMELEGDEAEDGAGDDEAKSGLRDLKAYFTTPGQFTVEYAVIDSSGNIGIASRVLYVDPESIVQQRAADAAGGSAGIGVAAAAGSAGGGVVLVMLLVALYVRRKRQAAASAGTARGGGRGGRRRQSATTANPMFSAGNRAMSRATATSQLPVPAPEVWHVTNSPHPLHFFC